MKTIDDLKNCESCSQRKEALIAMLTGKHFWVGVIVGAGGVYIYKRMKG